MSSDEGRRRSSFMTLFKGNNNVFMINLVCPDNTIITQVHSVRETVREIIKESCNKLDINRPEIFGIAFYENNEYRFISQKKNLNKFLPSASMLTPEQAKEMSIIDTNVVLDSTIKACRLYLRVRHFYVNIDELSDQTLSYYYEQVRLDILKFQNWLNLCGYNDIFILIAAKTLWLTYGNEAMKILENDEKPLHCFLPQCEKQDDTKDILLKQIEAIHAEYDHNENLVIIDSHMESSICNYDNATKIQNGQETFANIPNITIDNESSLIHEKVSLMVSVIKSAMKLPYYGMYFYHVKILQENNTKQHNCKLGIGPFGISVTLSLNFTTWDEIENFEWSSVDEIDYQKNILDIYEDVPNAKRAKLHQFECLNDREAKYLYKQLRESHLFHIKILEKHKKNFERKRINSVGIFPEHEFSDFDVKLMKSSSLISIRPRSASDIIERQHGNQFDLKPLCRTKSN